MVNQPQKCSHNKIKRCGFWKGINTGGPVVKCLKCGKKVYFTWEKWKETPLKQKVFNLNPEPHIPDEIIDELLGKRLSISILNKYRNHIDKCDLCKRTLKRLKIKYINNK